MIVDAALNLTNMINIENIFDEIERDNAIRKQRRLFFQELIKKIELVGDPRYLTGIEQNISTLFKLELSMDEIEHLFLNSSHHLYHHDPRPDVQIRELIELQLKENGSVDVFCGGKNQSGQTAYIPLSQENKLYFPLSVFHTFTYNEIEELTFVVNRINEEPDFIVLWYRAEDSDILRKVEIQVLDLDFSRLEEYSDRVHAVFGERCLRVGYPDRGPSVFCSLVNKEVNSHAFIKAYPITCLGLIAYKPQPRRETSMKRAVKDVSTVTAFLSDHGGSNIQVLDDNPEFWKIAFDMKYLWVNQFYQEIVKSFDVELYTNADSDNFKKIKYTGVHFDYIVEPPSRSYIDDEDVIRAISNGNGEFFGRD